MNNAGKLPDLGNAERAVYHLVEAGGIDVRHAALYRRELGALFAHGLVKREHDGAYAVVPALGMRAPTLPPPDRLRPPAPIAPPRPPPMETLVVRVPAEWIAELDARGPDRSRALRTALAAGLEATRKGAGSGERRKAG